jgi:hypothetical protein
LSAIGHTAAALPGTGKPDFTFCLDGGERGFAGQRHTRGSAAPLGE